MDMLCLKIKPNDKVVTMLHSVNHSAIQGIRKGMDDLARDAQTVAHANVVDGNTTQDLTGALVNTTLTEAQIEAAVEVLKAADETLGFLLDTNI